MTQRIEVPSVGGDGGLASSSRTAFFEYVEIFHDRKRRHSSARDAYG